MKPDNFLKQLWMDKEIPKIKDFLAHMDKQLGTEADFYKQTFCMSLLLKKAWYSILKTWSSNTYDFKRNASQLKFLIFDVDFVKALHAFQSKYASAASSKWRSEADCIAWPKTIQELCSLVWVTPSVWAVEIDAKFSQANYTAKEKYARANEAQKQIDTIMLDKWINSIQKVKSMVDVCKKTTTKADDWTDKRYAAVVYMIVNIQMMLPKISETEKKAIIWELSVFWPEIKKYWNEQNTNDKVSKSNDFLKDVNKWIEQNEKNKQQINTALWLSESWIAYYQKESPKAYEKLKSQMDRWISVLKSLGQINTSLDLNKQIKNALLLIFRSTEYNKMSSTHQENYIDYRVNKHDIYTPTEMYDNGQEWILQWVMNILTDSKTNRKNESQITTIRLKALEQFRLIDKSYDSLIPILDGYNSWDAIVGNILNQDEW